MYTARSASYIYLHLESDNDGQPRTTLQHKTLFQFPIVSFQRHLHFGVRVYVDNFKVTRRFLFE
jgi:hypothetical protein